MSKTLIVVYTILIASYIILKLSKKNHQFLHAIHTLLLLPRVQNQRKSVGERKLLHVFTLISLNSFDNTLIKLSLVNIK